MPLSPPTPPSPPSLPSRRALLRATVAGPLVLPLGVGTLGWPSLSVARTGGDKRLVVIVLRGGMDGLAAVPPYADPDHAALRQALAPPPPDRDGGVIDLDGFYGLHPALAPLAEWYKAGELAVLHAIASPYRERSHFDAQDLLENGTTTPHATATGWLNRAVAELADAHGAGDRRLGLAIGQSVPLILRGPMDVASWAPSPLREADADFLARVGALYQGDALLAPALEAGIASTRMVDADLTAGAAMSEDMGKQAKGINLTPALMGEMAGRLLADPQGPRIASMDLTGWDTHVGQGAQKGRLASALDGLALTLTSLKTALGEHWRDTAVAVITEFGRTAHPNGTGGTDHGTATAAFLAGGAVLGGRVIADWPGLDASRLYQGRDLAPTRDLRTAMKGLLADHMGITAKALDTRVFPASAGLRALPELVRL